MNAWLEYKAKVAVWNAAVGSKAELIKMLRSDDPFPLGAREQLALLIEGKLFHKPRKRGRPVLESSPSIAVVGHLFSPIGKAVSEYQAEAKKMRQAGQLRGNVNRLTESIAQRNNVTLEALHNALRKGHPLPRLPEYESDEAAPFRRWVADKAVLKAILPKKSRK